MKYHNINTTRRSSSARSSDNTPLGNDIRHVFYSSIVKLKR